MLKIAPQSNEAGKISATATMSFIAFCVIGKIHENLIEQIPLAIVGVCFEKSMRHLPRPEYLARAGLAHED